MGSMRRGFCRCVVRVVARRVVVYLRSGASAVLLPESYRQFIPQPLLRLSFSVIALRAFPFALFPRTARDAGGEGWVVLKATK